MVVLEDLTQSSITSLTLTLAIRYLELEIIVLMSLMLVSNKHFFFQISKMNQLTNKYIELHIFYGTNTSL